MKWSIFKNRIKEDLYDYKSKENALDIWDSIHADVDVLNEQNKKKDNRFLFFLVFLIGFSAVTYFIMQEKQVIFDEEAVNELSLAINEVEEKSKENIENIKTSELSFNEKDLVENDKVKNFHNKNTSQVSQKEIALAKNENKNRMIASSSNEFKTRKDSEIDDTKSEIAKQNFSPVKNILSPIIEKEEIMDLGEGKPSITAQDFEVATLDKALTSDIKALQLLKLNLFEIENEITLPKVEYEPYKRIENVKTSIPKFSMGLNVGASYANKELTAKKPEDVSFLNQRIMTEESLEVLHGSLYGSYAINSNFGFSLGLDVTRINEAFSFVEVKKEDAFIQGVKYTFPESGINVTRLQEIGEVRETTTTTTDYILFNKYDLIDIPLLISYQLNKNKWSYGMQAGIIANINFVGKGRILKSEEHTELISDQNVFKKTLGLSYAVNIFVEHRMNNSLSLILTPSFRYFPNDFTKENYSLSQRYQFVGMDVGVKYYFVGK